MKEVRNRNAKPLNFVIQANWFHFVAVGQLRFHRARIISNIPNQMRNYGPRMECNLRYGVGFSRLVGDGGSEFKYLYFLSLGSIKNAIDEEKRGFKYGKNEKIRVFCAPISQFHFKILGHFQICKETLSDLVKSFLKIFLFVILIGFSSGFA